MIEKKKKINSKRLHVKYFDMNRIGRLNSTEINTFITFYQNKKSKN